MVRAAPLSGVLEELNHTYPGGPGHGRRASPAYASPNHGQDAGQSEGLSVAAWTPPQCPPPGEWRGQLWKVLDQAHPHSPAPGRGDLDAVAARDENPAVSLPGRAPGRRRLPRRRPPASCSPVAPRALERGASQENGCPLDISPAGEDTEAQSSSAICQTSHTQRGLEEQTFILSRSGGWEFKTTAWAALQLTASVLLACPPCGRPLPELFVACTLAQAVLSARDAVACSRKPLKMKKNVRGENEDKLTPL
ncbi:uncharacterized protein LOC122218545 [Panthera leo]|uniref:uncharacterized protein LOC122218545 n=1 Tax=Panthera leo TaxID=9689 RepID=UPI001C6A73B2|nr:uncharacterized protein LOC122218545 [Panthera leo]